MMERGERADGVRRPHLVYSDLAVVDRGRNLIDRSFLHHSRLQPGPGQPLRTLLARSFVLGCACLVNRPLLQFALPMPPDVASHDWWVALCGAAVGQLSRLPEALVQYRRHAAALSGPTGFWSGFNPLRYRWPARWRRGRANFARSLEQARAIPRPAPPAASPRRHAARPRRAILPHVRGAPQRRTAAPRPEPPGDPRVLNLPRRWLYYLCVLTLPRTGGNAGAAQRQGGDEDEIRRRHTACAVYRPDRQPQIDVLLATCNGARFLEEQVQSLLAHRATRGFACSRATTPRPTPPPPCWPSWPLAIRTRSRSSSAAGGSLRLRQFRPAAPAHPGRLRHVLRPGRRLAAGEDRADAAGHASPRKRRCGAGQPLLVHTDLAVVDEALQPLGRSFWAYQHLNVRRGRHAQPPAQPERGDRLRGDGQPGAGAEGRAAAAGSGDARLVARPGGGCFRPPRSRRRAAGALSPARRQPRGRRPLGLPHLLEKARTFFDRRSFVEALRRNQRQAESLLARFDTGLSAAQREVVATYAGLCRRNFFARRGDILRYGFYRTGWLRNLDLLARV